MRISRRELLRACVGLGASALGASLLAACAPSAPPVPAATQAPAKPAEAAKPAAAPGQPGTAPVKLEFWTFENPQQRPWIKSRIDQYVEKNRNVSVDFQYFLMPDVGKKLAVGIATGTAPDIWATGVWYMPTWLHKNALAPLDIQQLGYGSVDAYRADFPDALMKASIKDGKVYGWPFQFYGFLLYINTKQFKEVGLDPAKDFPKTWEQLGEIAKKLTIKEGTKFTRQGFYFNMHAPIWTMIQFSPILIQSGGQWFGADGKSTVNSEAGVKAMTIRASYARQYQVEDPADKISTPALPMMDWLKERAAICYNHPIPPAAIQSENPKMASEAYYMAGQVPGVEAGKGYPTSYGFNFVLSSQSPADRRTVAHDLLKFIMSDNVDLCLTTCPLTPARKSGWADDPRVKDVPFLQEVTAARDTGVQLPESIAFDELADVMHRAVQKIMLNNADIKPTLDQAAEEIDRATAAARA